MTGGTIDLEALRSYRLGRVRGQLAARGYAGLLLYDPLNIRYATDTSNTQVNANKSRCLVRAPSYSRIAGITNFRGLTRSLLKNPRHPDARKWSGND